MAEAIVMMRHRDDLSPNPTLIPVLASKVTWAADTQNLVRADHPALPPPDPERVGVPKGAGGRNSVVPAVHYVCR